MSEKIKILGYSKNKETNFIFDYKETKACSSAFTSGKSVFDFMYFEKKYILGVFRDVSDSLYFEGIEAARHMAFSLTDENSCIAAYLYEFLDCIAAGTEEALSEFTAFMGAGFVPPSINSPNYKEELINSIFISIQDKQDVLKYLAESSMFADTVPKKEFYIGYEKKYKVVDFNFNCFLSSEMTPIMFPLKTADDIIRFDLMQMFAKGLEFRPCRCCGRHFVPDGRSDSQYCDRPIFGQFRTCEDVGALKVFAESHENDPIHKAYIKAYRRMDSRKRSKLITEEEFKEFGKTARAERQRCYDGEITLEQFQAWLDEYK